MKYIIFGISGKMGPIIDQVAKEKNHELVKGFNSKDSFDVDIDAEVAIDFSHESAFDKVLSYCVSHKIPLVSGTTGLSEKSFQKIEEAAKVIPILWASNTSLGIQVLRSLLSPLAVLKNWDAHIVESHHINKKDAPSGTAKTLANDLKGIMKKEDIEISAIRGGGIYGEHEIHIMGEGETIRIKHQALSRKLFADGAVKAAEFLIDKEPRLYTMNDLLDH